MSGQHPWFYCWVISLSKKLFFHISGSDNYILLIGIFSFIQIIFVVFLESYILYSLYKEGAHPMLLLAAEIYYFMNPTLMIFSLNFQKDIPFSLSLAAFVILMKQIIYSKEDNISRKKLFLLFLLMAAMILCRNNGIYIVAVALSGLFICLMKQYKKWVLLLIGCIIIVTVPDMAVKRIGREHLFKETAGVPLQQMAAVVAKDGEINDEQMDFLNKVMPIEDIKERYNPYTVDTLKWGGSTLDNQFLNNNKVDFLRIWAQMLPNNLDIYIEAYLKLTYGFWSISDNSVSPIYSSMYVEGFDHDWMERHSITQDSIVSNRIRDRIVEAGSRFLGEGQCIWIFITIILIMFCTGYDRRMMWVMSPFITLCFTLALSLPVYHQWRYIYVLPLCFPLLFHYLLGKMINTD